MSDNPVLAAVDFSPDSDKAFEYALGLCARLDRDLMLVHAWDPGGWIRDRGKIEGEVEFLDSGRELAADSLEHRAARAKSVGIETEIRLVDGPAPKAVAELAEQTGPCLVVVGRRGASQPIHVALGSVAERVVRLVGRPVLVVPRDAPEPRSLDRILVGVDFSAGSEETIEFAARLAKGLQMNGGLLAVHAFPSDLDSWRSADPDEPGGTTAKELQQIRLEEWIKNRNLADVSCEARAVFGRADDMLRALAQQEDCDWIALGMQGQGALTPFVMGRTTESLLKRSERPVLTVGAAQAPDFEPPD